MCTRKIVSIILFLSLFCGNLSAVSPAADSLFPVLTNLSVRYLNYNCSVAGDSVLKICDEAIRQATGEEDYMKLFRAGQLAVNAHCLQGDIGRGISMSKEMYEKAKALNTPAGKALALQTIGATYMYTDQYAQALSTFSEALSCMNSAHDTLSQASLTVQQLHCYMGLADTVSMQQGLAKLNGLIPYIPSGQQDIYLFYSSCYETVAHIKNNQAGKAQESLGRMLQLLPGDKGLDIWRYSVQADFYRRTGNTGQALACFDSTLSIVGQFGPSNMFQKLIYEKADILEKTQNYPEACRMYALADSLDAILNMEHYTNQIEDLHLIYYIDQASIENTRMHNKFLSYILFASLAVMTVAAVLIIRAKKRNRQLSLSREKLDNMRQITADSIQSKSIFLSNMSHDLRTPLNAIVGFSGILTTTDDIEPELKEQCRDYIRSNSDLLMKLVDDIIDFSTLKEAKIKFDFGKCDVLALCHSVAETVAKVKQTEARLTFSSTVAQLEIETDIQRLQQVLINLLTNAAKFTKEGEIRLLLDYNRETDEAIFTVEDTGCGIPLEKQARIFERFEKLHESVQGVGLGLSICKLIIDHVHGKIWIDSGYTAGARFVFTHPVNPFSKHPGK